EEELRHRRGAQAHLREGRTDRQPGGVPLDEEGAEASEAQPWVGRRKDDEQTALRGVRHEGLGAGEHPRTRPLDRRRAQREHVRPRLGLRRAVRGDERAVAQARQVALPLLLGAEAYEGALARPEPRVQREDQAVVRAPVAEALERGRDRRHAGAAPSVLLGHRKPLQTELRALPPGLTREDAFVVAEEELLVELLLRELDDGLVQQSLVVVEIREIDDRRAACLRGHGRWVGIARYLP